MDPNQALRNLTGDMAGKKRPSAKDHADKPPAKRRARKLTVSLEQLPNKKFTAAPDVDESGASGSEANAAQAEVPQPEATPAPNNESAPLVQPRDVTPAPDNNTAPVQPEERTPAPDNDPAKTEDVTTAPDNDSNPPAQTEDVTTTAPEPEETAAPVQPDETTAPEQPEETAAPVQPDETAAPVQPEETAAPVQPDETAAPVQPEETAAPVQPEETAAPVQPEETAAPVQPEETAAPVKPEETAGPVQPEETAAPVQPEETSVPTPIEETTESDKDNGPDDDEAAFDAVLRPRQLVAGTPSLRLPIDECNVESVITEPSMLDGTLSTDKRTDLVWKKMIQNDYALMDFLLCNFAGHDLLSACWCTGSPYTHVLVKRPLTSREIQRLDELVSFYTDPDRYYQQMLKERFVLSTPEFGSAETVVLSLMQSPLEEALVVTGLSFGLQHWGERSEDAIAKLSVVKCGVEREVMMEKSFSLSHSDTDFAYTKAIIYRLGGKIDPHQTSFLEIRGTVSSGHARLIGGEVLIGKQLSF